MKAPTLTKDELRELATLAIATHQNQLRDKHANPLTVKFWEDLAMKLTLIIARTPD